MRHKRQRVLLRASARALQKLVILSLFALVGCSSVVSSEAGPDAPIGDARTVIRGGVHEPLSLSLEGDTAWLVSAAPGYSPAAIEPLPDQRLITRLDAEQIEVLPSLIVLNDRTVTIEGAPYALSDLALEVSGAPVPLEWFAGGREATGEIDLEVTIRGRVRFPDGTFELFERAAVVLSGAVHLESVGTSELTGAQTVPLRAAAPAGSSTARLAIHFWTRGALVSPMSTAQTRTALELHGQSTVALKADPK